MNQSMIDDETRLAGERLRLRVAGLASGSKLPPERVLATQLGISRAQLRQVLAQLADEGMLTRRQGAGTFIAQVPTTVASSLSQELSHWGLAFEVSLLSFERVPAPPTSVLQGEVIRLRRKRTVQGRTVSYEISHVVGDAALEAQTVTRGSLYAQLGALGMAPVEAREQLAATLADEETAAVLGCERGAPLLLVHRLGITRSGRIVEDVVTLLRGDCFRLTTGSDRDAAEGLASMLTYIHPDDEEI